MNDDFFIYGLIWFLFPVHTSAALSKRVFGETVARIKSAFPHWFCPAFNQYASNEANPDDLDIDADADDYADDEIDLEAEEALEQRNRVST